MRWLRMVVWIQGKERKRDCFLKETRAHLLLSDFFRAPTLMMRWKRSTKIRGSVTGTYCAAPIRMTILLGFALIRAKAASHSNFVRLQLLINWYAWKPQRKISRCYMNTRVYMRRFWSTVLTYLFPHLRKKALNGQLTPNRESELQIIYLSNFCYWRPTNDFPEFIGENKMYGLLPRKKKSHHFHGKISRRCL